MFGLLMLGKIAISHALKKMPNCLVINRVVECTLQDGTVLNETKCSSDDKPTDLRLCNQFTCDFCKQQPDKTCSNPPCTVCGDHGECLSKLYTCDCESGYAGDYCQYPPQLNFTGITSQVYYDISAGETITERANPCHDTNDSIVTSYDAISNTRTVPIDLDSLELIYIGATLGVRWSSEGDISLLAVGLEQYDDKGKVLNPDEYPMYVGYGLAADDQTCDDRNSTSFDECYEDMSCNDFVFQVPTDIYPGFYKLLIRFNNAWFIESPILNITCSNNTCNGTGHGHCSSDDKGCICHDGWYGDVCDYSPCKDWSFSICDYDETTGGCVSSIGLIDYKPTCFSSDCNIYALINETGDTDIDSLFDELGQCETISSNSNADQCSDLHYEGKYCEVPIDYCGTLNATACDYEPECTYNNSANACVYADCSMYLNEEVCYNVSTYYEYNDQWSDFCYWNTSLGLCNRVTCGGVLPKCNNGAVRRPLFDKYGEYPQSICYAWYCDCSHVLSPDETYWKTSSISSLVVEIDEGFDWDEPLTSEYIDNEALFTCQDCKLKCKNGAEVDEYCTICDGCDLENKPFRGGVECDQVFWIANFELDVDWEAAFIDNWDTFEPLIIQDIAYFLDTDTKHISIWQLKPKGSNAIVYFRYLFDTDDESEAQITGGDVMVSAQSDVKDDSSTAYRGFIMQYTNPSYEFGWCLPTKEECDPDKGIDLIFYFYICLGCSFGFEILCVIIYRIATRGKRQRLYEEKVREVRQAQLRLMEHHSKARRVGMRDVGKGRAHKIHKQKVKKHKLEEKEMKRRESKEKQHEKQKAKDFLNQPGANGSHKQNDSALELEQYRRFSNQSDYQPGSEHGSAAQRTGPGSVAGRSSRAASFQSQDPSNLPIGWKIYYNQDGIPYYYNTQTGQTTWRHPKDPNALN